MKPLSSSIYSDFSIETTSLHIAISKIPNNVLNFNQLICSLNEKLMKIDSEISNIDVPKRVNLIQNIEFSLFCFVYFLNYFLHHFIEIW